MKLRFLHILFFVHAFSYISCNKEDVKGPDPSGERQEEEIIVADRFEDPELYEYEGRQANVKVRDLHIAGDTLFLALDNKTVQLVSLDRKAVLATIDKWEKDGNEFAFKDRIDAITVSEKYIYVGTFDSRITVYDRKTLKQVNIIGHENGWSHDKYGMDHCFGMIACGDKIFIRDKMYIKAWYEPEVETEPMFSIPQLGRVFVSTVKYTGLGSPNGSNYLPFGMTSYKDQVFVTDYVKQTIQVFSPDKMPVVFGTEVHPDVDTVFSYTSNQIHPVDIATLGGYLLLTTNNSGNIMLVDPATGEFIRDIALFSQSGIKVCRMAIYRDKLFFTNTNGSNYSGDLYIAHGRHDAKENPK